MDISSLGIQNPASLQAMQLNGQFTSGLSANNIESFEESLRRAFAANEDSQAGVRRYGQMPVDKNSKLYEMCLELETFLVKNLLTSMRNTVQKSGLIDDSFAGKMYEDMLYDEYAKDYTKNANFGLAEQAYRQLSGY